LNDAPQLLIEWSSPWQEFVSAIGPALRRSPPRLPAETRAGLFPFRGLLISLLLEFVAVAAAIVQPANSVQLATVSVSERSHDVIYFSADELPRTEDVAGSQSGQRGKSGGSSMHHPTQVIQVARDTVPRERVTDAPRLDLPKSDSQVSNLLAYREDAGPAPAEALPLSKRSFGAALAVAPPPAALPQSQLRAVQFAIPAVVPPPVELPQQNFTANRRLAVAAVVVPPPVSVPARATSQLARLTLSTEMVVAPRPEIGSTARSKQKTNELTLPVAPPPVEIAALRAQTPTALSGALSGTQSVAPPRQELQNAPRRAVAGLGSASVVSPVVDFNFVRQQKLLVGSEARVLPPPNSSSENSSSSAGTGSSKAPLSPAAGVVVSPRPGEMRGLPPNPEKATVAMSPAGSAAIGTGGEGVGTGFARGANSAGASSGANSGAASASANAGKGAAAFDHAGSSPIPGPGGAGNLSNGRPRVPGVSVSGGNNVVSLPSFGATPQPTTAGRSDVARKASNGITVVASPRSGGALNFYGALKGDRVYTIYIPSTIGTVVMQFADPASATQSYAEDLTAPTPMRAELPPDLQRSHLVIRCVLDRNGIIRNPSVVRSEAAEFQSKILAALPDWKFTPAFRGNEAVEVNVILGFGVDTK